MDLAFPDSHEPAGRMRSTIASPGIVETWLGW